MRSLTASLARQGAVALAMGALLGAALSTRSSDDHRASATSPDLDKPILTRAVMTATAPPPAQVSAPVKPIAATKPVSARPRVAAAPSPPPRPAAEPAPEPTPVAYAAPAAQPEPQSLKKRLLAPITFVRDSFARLISWP
jgi:outer membrane biosynthesis protein TonB